MRDLFQSAVLGWKSYTENGKYAALLLAVLLVFWMWQRIGGGKRRKISDAPLELMVYTTLVTAACICPVTAVFLLLYQTRFYQYVWIWSIVPITAVIAAGGSVFLGKLWEDDSGAGKKDTLRAVILTAVAAVLLFFCGSMGQQEWSDAEKGSERVGIEAVIRSLAEETEGEICLWAPREVMACARSCNGEIRLLYGRDMWDAALGAYSYEVYDEKRQELYRWMSHAEAFGTLQGTVEVLSEDAEGRVLSAKRPVDGKVCIQDAIDMGANCILLPGNMQAEDLEQIESLFSVEAEELGGYLLLRAAR